MSGRPVVAVLGAGTMGHGIAQVAATAGHSTVLHDPVEGAAARGLERIRSNLDRGVELGKVDPADREATLGKLTLAPELAEAVAGAGVVIEAAPESIELKHGLLREVEAATGATTILASNTSSIRIGRLAEVLGRPERFLGLHFFNPVHLMALVEVVWGPATSPATREFGVDFARSLGKEPIEVRDSPGFASSRLGVLLGLEAIRMVEEGVAEARAIDRAMELGYRHPMGPLRLTDLVGLDVRLGIAEYLHAELGSEAFKPPQLLRRMVSEGRLGRKAGRGFYDWEDA